MITLSHNLDPVDHLYHQLHLIGGIANLIESVIDCVAESDAGRHAGRQIYCCAEALRNFANAAQADLFVITDELKNTTREVRT